MITTELIVAFALLAFTLLVSMGLVLFVLLRRRGGRLGIRRLLLEGQLEFLGDGPERGVVRLRLQLDEALRSIHDFERTPRADRPGDFGLLSTRVADAAQRVAEVLDELLGLRIRPVSSPAFVVLRDQVRGIEDLVAKLSEASIRAATGVTGVELDDLSRDLDDQLVYIENRNRAIRELTPNLPVKREGNR